MSRVKRLDYSYMRNLYNYLPPRYVLTFIGIIIKCGEFEAVIAGDPP